MTSPFSTPTSVRKTVSLLLITLAGSGCTHSSTSSSYGTVLDVGPSQVSSSKVQTDFTLRLVGEIASPTSDGSTLQANDLYFENNKAYIGYNVAGATQKGAIQVVDASVSAAPKLLSQLILDDTDVNGVFVKGSDLYLVGATSAEDAGPAVVMKYGLDSNGFPIASSKSRHTISSYAGTSVYANDTHVYATSGNTGGLTVFTRADMSQVATSAVADARSVRGSTHANNTNIYVFGAGPGKIEVFNSVGASQATHTTGGANTPESKSTIAIGKSMALVSLGESGTKLICLTDGNTLASIAPVSVSGIDPSLTVTNAAVSSSGLLFTANGEAGVHVYSFKKGTGNGNSANCKDNEFTLLGAIQFGSAISANFVAYRDKLLFVATGLGGLKIVSIDKLKGASDEDDFDSED